MQGVSAGGGRPVYEKTAGVFLFSDGQYWLVGSDYSSSPAVGWLASGAACGAACPEDAFGTDCTGQWRYSIEAAGGMFGGGAPVSSGQWLSSDGTTDTISVACPPPSPPLSPPPPSSPTPPTSPPPLTPSPSPPPHDAMVCGGLVIGDTTGLDNVVGNNAPDELHPFCVTTPGTFTFSTCGGATWDTHLRLFDQVPGGTELAENDDSCGTGCAYGCQYASTLTTSLGVGCYVLVVDGYDTYEGSYELSVSCDAGGELGGELFGGASRPPSRAPGRSTGRARHLTTDASPPSPPPSPPPPSPPGTFLTTANLAAAVAEWASDPSAATVAHGPVGSWDVTRVTDMQDVAKDVSGFNADLNSWDVPLLVGKSGLYHTSAWPPRTPCCAPAPRRG